VSAAGGHHLFLSGPPGAGKTMLAERLPGLLPHLDDEAALEVSCIHSVAGTLPANRPLLTRPPYSAPHHTATLAAVVGGGSGIPRPGAMSLAHCGVLFMDEAPEFANGILDALRQPLESGEITVSRSAAAVRFPARFTLVLAANPCPCARPPADCSCSPQARRRYTGRLSGPILDRIDIRAELYRVTRGQLVGVAGGESTASVATRVHTARDRARARLAGTPWTTNAEVPGSALRRDFRVPRLALDALDGALDRGLLTARGVDRVLRLAWTVADLAGRDAPTTADVTQAITLRTGLAWGARAA
jgi:magnesium chelatase family protein